MDARLIEAPRDEDDRTIPSRAGDFYWVKKLDDEDNLGGCISILGRMCHVIFIKVEEDKDGVRVATKDPYERLNDVYAVDSEGVFNTVEVPGFEGEYVLAITPGK